MTPGNITAAADKLGIEEEEVKEYLAWDFEDQEEPGFDDLVEHIYYQMTVCQADDPRAAFLANY